MINKRDSESSTGFDTALAFSDWQYQHHFKQTRMSIKYLRLAYYFRFLKTKMRPLMSINGTSGFVSIPLTGEIPSDELTSLFDQISE